MEKNVENGLVCYADILGYLNIIENNDIEKCASIINEIIIGIDIRLIDKTSAVFHDNVRTMELIKTFLNECLTLTVVSDTIIFFFDLDKLPTDKTLELIFITLYLGLFINDCFFNGIPVRASIEYGSYYLKDNIFAGKVIADGYQNTSNMDFSGLCLSEGARIFFEEAFFKDNIKERIEFYNHIYHKVLANFKSGEKKVVLHNWILLDRFVNKDIRQLIFESFQKHNKDISDSALKKIINTEKIIRKFISYEQEKNLTTGST